MDAENIPGPTVSPRRPQAGPIQPAVPPKKAKKAKKAKPTPQPQSFFPPGFGPGGGDGENGEDGQEERSPVVGEEVAAGPGERAGRDWSQQGRTTTDEDIDLPSAVEEVVPHTARAAAIEQAAKRHKIEVPTDIVGVRPQDVPQIGFDDEGPIDETEQQATQQQIGTRTVTTTTADSKPKKKKEWGETATTFDLDPGDEGMPPVGEDIYGHGREGQEDAEGSAELPPDVSRYDKIRESARDKGMKTEADIVEKEGQHVVDIINKPEEEAKELNLDQSLVGGEERQARPQPQQKQAPTFTRTMPGQGAEAEPEPDPSTTYRDTRDSSGRGSGFHGEQKWLDPNATEPAKRDIGGFSPHELPRTAAEFEAAGEGRSAGLLSRLGAAPEPLKDYFAEPEEPGMAEGGEVQLIPLDHVPQDVLEKVANAAENIESFESQQAIQDAIIDLGGDRRALATIQQIIAMVRQYRADPSMQVDMAGTPQASQMQRGGVINGGSGDAMADDILVNADMGMNGIKQPIKVSAGEYIVPGDVLAHLGSGNTNGGAEVMDQLVEDVRIDRTGTSKQPGPIDLRDVLPSTYGGRYA